MDRPLRSDYTSKDRLADQRFFARQDSSVVLCAKGSGESPMILKKAAYKRAFLRTSGSCPNPLHKRFGVDGFAVPGGIEIFENRFQMIPATFVEVAGAGVLHPL